MHSETRFAALLLIAFIVVNVQCAAVCATGMCPHPVEQKSHCPRHPSGKIAHYCQAPQPFPPKAAGKAVAAPIAVAFFAAAPAAPAAIPDFVPPTFGGIGPPDPPHLSSSVLRI